MKKRAPIALSDPENEFHKLIRANAHRHHAYDVFRDFCELYALSLSNAVDRLNYDRREARYLAVVGKYEPAEVERFMRMAACVVVALEAGMGDVLGRMFMGLDLGDAGKGQFFTPYEVSLMMAQMILTDAPARIERTGFITINEPSVGAGGMVIAAADTLQRAGVNYQQHMHVVAVDIDATACHMTYIQMSLLHIPGIVVHGNSLSGEASWDSWWTPAHLIDGWDRKLSQRRAIDRLRQLIDEPPPDALSPNTQHSRNDAAQAAQVTYDRVNREREIQRGQMALF